MIGIISEFKNLGKFLLGY